MAEPTHLPTGNIVWQHEDGSVAITHVFFDVDPAKWRDTLIERGDAPKGAKAVAINAELPADYSARADWTFDGQRVVARK